MTKTTSINWEKAKRFYSAGIISVETIATQVGCSRQAIYLKIKQEKWKRDLAPKVRRLVKCKLDKKADC